MDHDRKTIAIAYGMELSHGIRRAIIGALALVYFLSLGFNLITVTTLFAISGIIMMLFEFPTGAIADYDSRRKSLIISYFLFAVAFFGVFLFKDFWLLAIFWVLGDIAWTFSTGAGSAWITDELKYGKDKSKLITLISREYFFEKLGHIIGGLVALVIVAINFRFIWLVISIVYFLLMLVMIFFAEERNFSPEKVPHNYLKKTVIKAKESYSYVVHKSNKELRVLLIGGFLSVFAISSFFIGVPLMFTETFGMKPEFLGGLFSIFAVFSLGATFIAEKITHKKGVRLPLIIISLLMGTLIISFSLSPYLLMAIIVLGLFLVFETINDVIEDASREFEFSSKIRASLGSLDSINWAIANSLGIFLAGIGISIFGLINTMMISGLIGILVAAIYLIGLKK